jgi:hypothetical protein
MNEMRKNPPKARDKKEKERLFFVTWVKGALKDLAFGSDLFAKEGVFNGANSLIKIDCIGGH